MKGTVFEEFFARALFPAPLQLFSRGLFEEECHVHWHNQPKSGLLSGLIFTDSSSRWKTPILQRAGWSVVSVDPFGKVIAAAWGAVPIDMCPSQDSAAAEDYAVLMASRLDTGHFELYIDNANTLRCCKDKAFATIMAHERAHLWEQIH